MNLDGLLALFKGFVTTSNYDTLVSILATEVTTHMEKVVIKSTFNRVIIIHTEMSCIWVDCSKFRCCPTLAASSYCGFCVSYFMSLCGVGAVWNRILCRLPRYNSKLWNFCFIHSLDILYSADMISAKCCIWTKQAKLAWEPQPYGWTLYTEPNVT
jgi:hypothetical protein